MSDLSSLPVANRSDFSHAFAGGDINDFWALLKPRVMSLVVFSGFAGLMVAPGEIHPLTAMIAIFAIAIGSGAAGAINMWYDRDIDAIMLRTQKRPVPAGRIPPAEALSFGVILAAASVIVMGLAVNWLAAILLSSAILFYVFIYTIWLKRRTAQNIVIGGAAGAFPPMIGWAAVTGDITLESFSLFLLIFFWTPPHFWSLALYKSAEYQKAGIPMLPVVAGDKNTRWQILIYTILLIPIAFLPLFFSMVGTFYLFASAVLGLLFLLSAVAVFFDKSEATAKRMFGYSIFYLFAQFSVLMLDSQTLALT